MDEESPQEIEMDMDMEMEMAEDMSGAELDRDQMEAAFEALQDQPDHHHQNKKGVNNQKFISLRSNPSHVSQK